MKLYVGNLPWSTTNADLEEMFAAIGPVVSANVVQDRDTGRSRGFGFVEMENADARRAISELNGKTVDSRQLKVDQASDKPKRAGRF